MTYILRQVVFKGKVKTLLMHHCYVMCRVPRGILGMHLLCKAQKGKTVTDRIHQTNHNKQSAALSFVLREEDPRREWPSSARVT